MARGPARGNAMAVAAAAIVTALAAHPGAVQASGGSMGCDPHRTTNYLTYYWAGWINSGNPSGIQDVSSSIFEYSPWVNPDTSDFTSAWVMLVNQRTADYGQVGWYEEPGSVRHTFVEWTTGNNTFSRTFYAPGAIGYYDNFSMHTVSNGANYLYRMNGANLITGPRYFAPTESQILGETHTIASQMPGGTSHPEDFSSSYLRVNGGTYAFGGNPYTSDSRFYTVKYSGTDDQIADSACQN